MAAIEELPSPDTQAYINSYTPSKESQDSQDFFGRRMLRIMNGQRPETHPEKFTPLVDQRMKWPTNEEAYEWAEPGRKKRALFNSAMWAKVECQKKLKTPSGAAGSSSSPITDETAATASNTYAGPAVPIQL